MNKLNFMGLFMAAVFALAPMAWAAENFIAGETKTVTSPSTSSQRITFTDVFATVGPQPDVYVVNNTDVLVFFKCGNSSVTATANNVPVRSGHAVIFYKGQNLSCAVLASATPSAGSVYFVAGKGM